MVPNTLRWFGVIAAGGTAGGIVGPLLTALLVPALGTDKLLLVSALFLFVAVVCAIHLNSIHRRGNLRQDTSETVQPDFIRGEVTSGFRLILRSPYLLGISLMIILYATLSTFLYFQQLTIVESIYTSPVQRTTLFSLIELLANGLAMILQLLFTRKIISNLGDAWTLALVPIMLCFWFVVIWLSPVLGVIVTVQIFKRAGNYAITRPVREMLFVVLSKEEQYKAKNIIDTVVYRGGDMVSAWIYSGLSAGLGLGLSAIALIAVPISAAWAVVAYRLGEINENIVDKQVTQGEVSRLLPYISPKLD